MTSGSSRRSSAAAATTATGIDGGGGSRPRYAPEDPSLPKPWKALVDGSTGYLYYWNQDTNVTQYERPEPDLPPPPPVLPPPPPNPPPKSVSASAIHARSSTSAATAPRNSDRDQDRSRHGVDDGTDADRYRSSRTHQEGSGRGNNSHAHELHVKDSREAKMPFSKGHGSPEFVASSSAESYRRHHEIYVKGDNVPMPFTTFESTGFPSEILKEVHHAGFSSPTPIQAQAWPIALQSRDIVAIAKTGSGKTLGYLIPGFIHLKHLRNNNKVGPTVLVLAPTRELATQILDEAVKFGRSSRISSTCLYGGAPKGPQLRDLDRGVDVVVATPGRLNDILEMRRISLRQVSYLVLDEADRMLDMGFEPQIRKIVKEIPHRRQTLMFTATWPKEVRKIAADLLVNPVHVNIGSTDELVANTAITQYVEVITPFEKQRRLEQILRSQDPGSKVIIFCSTKRMCDQLARSLARQFGAAAIHGDKSQSERDRVLGQFRNGRSPILVATDVAARGLDIKDIRVVINYDFPTGVEDYVHRIGRTGRAGATGVSYTFFCEQDSKYASDLVKILSGANQRVPRELRDMVSRGGFGGKSRRWGSRADTRDGGRSHGRSDSSYSGRAGHDMPILSSRSDNKYGEHGANDRDISHDRYDHGYSANHKVDVHGHGSRGRGHSRSRSRSRSHSHSRNRRRYGASPKRGHTEHRPMHRSRSRSQNRGHSRSRSRSRTADRGYDDNDRTAQTARAVSPVPQKHSPGQRPYQEEERTLLNDNLVMVNVKKDDSPNPLIKGSGSPYSPMDKETPPVLRSPGQQHEGPVENGFGENHLEPSAPSPALSGVRSGEDEEEGMIPADEDGVSLHDEGNSQKNMSAVSVPV